MSDAEILSHYNLITLQPAVWPAEKDEDDISDNEHDARDGSKAHNRYTTLDRAASVRSSIIGSQKGKDGVETLVQRDEPDPLGRGDSVIRILAQRGLAVEDNSRLRNRFLLSSTTFNPSMYLSEVHKTATTEELLEGLDFLSKSIEKKSASLKILVESNFERFVRAKATIDNVYSEMRKVGIEPEPEKPVKQERSRYTPRQQSSRQGLSFRTSSGPFNQPSPVTKSFIDGRRKNALLKETEYGVQGIKVPLVEATVKAEEVWGPALGGREREQILKSALNSVEKNRSILEAGASIEDCIKRHDYEGLATEYTRAHKHVAEAKNMVDRAKTNDLELTDPQIQQIVLTSRVWMDVQQRISQFKKDIWKKLRIASTNSKPINHERDSHLDLISVLLQLGVEENPITVWLLARLDYLQDKVATHFERIRMELEVSRRRLGNGHKPSGKVLASYLRNASGSNHQVNELDAPQVLRFWDKLNSSLHSLLALQDSTLAEAVDFAETLHSFADGKKQRSLPIGIDGRSRRHHQLNPLIIQDLQQRTLKLFEMFREQVHGLFIDAPIEDFAQFHASIPPTPASPQPALLSPTKSRKFNFNPEDIPPPSPKLGEAWEKFAFWPPYSNSLSAVGQLDKIISLLAVATAEIVSIDLIKRDGRLQPRFRELINDIRDRVIAAICASWLSDSENCRELEDWTRSSEKKDLTNMPSYFTHFETELLDGLQKILYFSTAGSTSDISSVVSPPPQRHAEALQKAFKSSLYKAFNGMMEHIIKPQQPDESMSDGDGLTIPSLTGTGNELAIDAANANVRKLLTLSNLQALRSDMVPKLVTQFESNFSVDINEDGKAFREALGQMNARVFQAYVRPTIDQLRDLISKGIVTPFYGPVVPTTIPSDARPYVYDVLLSLVTVHSEVSATAPALTSQVLSYLLEQISSAQHNAFIQRQRYSLGALMQATLDVEFTAQTLNNYTTEKASELQGQIYLSLDERTDNDARLRLQTELPQMRAILKRLREATKGEFACFKRERRQRESGRDKARDSRGEKAA